MTQKNSHPTILDTSAQTRIGLDADPQGTDKTESAPIG
jgi:hypothetical protein